MSEFVVERSRRRDDLAEGPQNGGDQILGGGLARRPGDADDPQTAGSQFIGHRGSEQAQCGQYGRAGTVGIVLEHTGVRVGH